MAGAPPEPAAPAEARAFFEQEILRWFPDADWLSSEANHLPDQLEAGERMEAVGVGSVISVGGEIHGVVAITDRRVICQGFSRWAHWECPASAVTGYEPSSDDVTFYRVHADYEAAADSERSFTREILKRSMPS